MLVQAFLNLSGLSWVFYSSVKINVIQLLEGSLSVRPHLIIWIHCESLPVGIVVGKKCGDFVGKYWSSSVVPASAHLNALFGALILHPLLASGYSSQDINLNWPAFRLLFIVNMILTMELFQLRFTWYFASCLLFSHLCGVMYLLSINLFFHFINDNSCLLFKKKESSINLGKHQLSLAHNEAA